MQLDFSERGARHSDSAALRGFVQTISDGFCPFIASSVAQDVLAFSDYTLDELTEIGRGDPAAGLFYVGVVHAERLRQRRMTFWRADQPAPAALICDNLTLVDSETLSWRSAKDIVDWPHYLLKWLYSEVGLMFGKFWTNEEGRSLKDRPIPTTPVTFLSIRSAVRLRDPALLKEQTEFADLIRDAEDDGQDMLARRIGVPGHGASAELLARGNYFTLAKEAMQLMQS
jgi:hypothetical protein